MYKSLNTGHLGIKLNSFEKTLTLAKNHNYGAVGYSPAELENEGVGVYEALDLMGQYGVIISDMGLPVQITSRDAFNSSFPILEKTARTASRLGIHRCCTWMMSWSNELEYAENFKFHSRMLRLIAEVLKEYDILFGVEFLGPRIMLKNGKYPFIHTLEQALELCGAIGTGNAGLMLDTHHCYCSGLNGAAFAQYIRDEKDIVLVHLNDDAPGKPLDEIGDSPRFYPGEPGSGAIDLHGFMNALKELKYTGPVVAEPFSETIRGMSDSGAIVRLISESTDSVWPGSLNGCYASGR